MLPNHISQFIWNITLTSLISKFETTQDDTGGNKVWKYYWQQSFPPSLANIFSKKNNWKIKCKKIIYAHLHIYSYKRQTMIYRSKIFLTVKEAIGLTEISRCDVFGTKNCTKVCFGGCQMMFLTKYKRRIQNSHL